MLNLVNLKQASETSFLQNGARVNRYLL